jgi:beta-xylosidase
VGRIPYLVPVVWADGWPVLGVNGKVPEQLDLPPNKSLINTLVQSDEFTRKKGKSLLPLAWQWNHNPDPENWSFSDRRGFLRLRTGRVDTSFFQVRNILTQRTIGPECAATTRLEVSEMKDGDFAGLTLFQKRYGQVGVKSEGGKRYVVMVSTETERPVEVERIPLTGGAVYLRAECNFKDLADTGEFFYSLDGKSWQRIGGKLKMSYTLPHFMGYRFGLFNYATKNAGGHVDFDFFRMDEIVD